MEFSDRVICNLSNIRNDIWTVQFSGPFNLKRSFYCCSDLEDYLTTTKDKINVTHFENDFLFVKNVPDKRDLCLEDMVKLRQFKDKSLYEIQAFIKYKSNLIQETPER